MESRLDHVGFVGPDLGELREKFVRLGFSPTTPQPLMQFDPATGVRTPLEQSSCHIVFEGTYIELSAALTTDPRQHLQAYEGPANRLQIVAFASNDIEATHAAVVSAGIRSKGVQWAARPVRYGAKPGEARFHWFMVDPADAPEGLVCFVHNTTPDLIYQPAVQHHALGACAVSGMAIVLPTADDAKATAARFARYPSGPDAAIRILEAREAEMQVGSAVLQAQSAFAALAVEVRSIGAAAAVLTAQAIPFETRPAGLVIPPLYAGGAALCLHAPGRVFF